MNLYKANTCANYYTGQKIDNVISWAPCYNLILPPWGNSVLIVPGESDGRRSLFGYSLWGRKESDATEQLTQIPSTFIKVWPGMEYKTLNPRAQLGLRASRSWESAQQGHRPAAPLCRRPTVTLDKRESDAGEWLSPAPPSSWASDSAGTSDWIFLSIFTPRWANETLPHPPFLHSCNWDNPSTKVCKWLFCPNYSC